MVTGVKDSCDKAMDQRVKVVQSEFQVAMLLRSQEGEHHVYNMMVPTPLHGADRATADVLNECYKGIVDFDIFEELSKVFDVAAFINTGDRDKANLSSWALPKTRKEPWPTNFSSKKDRHFVSYSHTITYSCAELLVAYSRR